LQFQIVTSRSIEKLSPKILILPNVKCINEDEAKSLKSLSEKGTKFILTGEFAAFNEEREMLGSKSLNENLFWLLNYFNQSQTDDYVWLKDCPGKSYTDMMKQEVNNYFKSEGINTVKMLKTRNGFLSQLSDLTSFTPEIKIDAPIDLITTTNVNEDYIYLFLTNIRGLTTVYDSGIKTVKDVKMSFADSVGTDEVYMLPFLGNKEKVNTQVTADEINFTIPEIERGMLIIIKRN
jgi:hypothetical protein